MRPGPFFARMCIPIANIQEYHVWFDRDVGGVGINAESCREFAAWLVKAAEYLEGLPGES